MLLYFAATIDYHIYFGIQMLYNSIKCSVGISQFPCFCLKYLSPINIKNLWYLKHSNFLIQFINELVLYLHLIKIKYHYQSFFFLSGLLFSSRVQGYTDLFWLSFVVHFSQLKLLLIMFPSITLRWVVY